MNKKDKQKHFDMVLINNYVFNMYYPEEVKKLKKKYNIRGDI